MSTPEPAGMRPAVEALKDLQRMIGKTATARSPRIRPAFVSLRYGGFFAGWHYTEAYFLCAAEYKAKCVSSQLRAMDVIASLFALISAQEADIKRGDWEGWIVLEGSKSVTHQWHDRKYPNSPPDVGFTSVLRVTEGQRIR